MKKTPLDTGISFPNCCFLPINVQMKSISNKTYKGTVYMTTCHANANNIYDDEKAGMTTKRCAPSVVARDRNEAALMQKR